MVVTKDKSLEQEIEELHKAYGNCHKCYGKGYSTGAELYSAKGKQWGETNKMVFCSCDRGKQLEAHCQKRELEARIDELNIVVHTSPTQSAARWTQENVKRRFEDLKIELSQLKQTSIKEDK